MSGFVNTSDWPLCSHAHRYVRDWLQWSTHRSVWKHTEVFESVLKTGAGAFESSRLSADRSTDRCLLSNASLCICVSTRWRASKISIYNILLKHWSLLPITDISDEHVNTMANQRCSRICSTAVKMLGGNAGIEVGTFDNTSVKLQCLDFYSCVCNMGQWHIRISMI